MIFININQQYTLFYKRIER